MSNVCPISCVGMKKAVIVLAATVSDMAPSIYFRYFFLLFVIAFVGSKQQKIKIIGT